MEEIWKLKCKIDLRNLRKNEAAVESLPEDIATERARMVSIKSAASGTAPVSGGGSRYDDRLNNSICLIGELEDSLKLTRREIAQTNRALAKLTDEERLLLERMYIDRQRDAVERLCEELNCDERTAWRKAAAALNSYCRIRYGR